MNSDSRWLSVSWEMFTDPAIHNAYHTSLYSVTIWMLSRWQCELLLFSQRQNETQGLFDPCAWTSQNEYCTTELYLSVDNLKKKKKKQHGRQRQGRDGVSVQMSMSMHCTVCDMLKLKELTQSVLSGYRCVQHDMLRIKQKSDKLSWGLDTTDACIVHKQTIHDCATTKTDLSEKRKTTKTPRRVSKREGTTSSTWIDWQTWLHFSICTCHPNSLPTLSQDCHITQ